MTEQNKLHHITLVPIARASAKRGLRLFRVDVESLNGDSSDLGRVYETNNPGGPKWVYVPPENQHLAKLHYDLDGVIFAYELANLTEMLMARINWPENLKENQEEVGSEPSAGTPSEPAVKAPKEVPPLEVRVVFSADPDFKSLVKDFLSEWEKQRLK